MTSKVFGTLSWNMTIKCSCYLACRTDCCIPTIGYFHAIWFDTLRPRQNGRHFPDDIFKFIFLNENVWILIKISLKFVPKSPIDNIPALFQIMAWHRPGDKPLSEAMTVSLLAHICVTRPQWVKYISLPVMPSEVFDMLFLYRYNYHVSVLLSILTLIIYPDNRILPFDNFNRILLSEIDLTFCHVPTDPRHHYYEQRTGGKMSAIILAATVLNQIGPVLSNKMNVY